MPEPVQVDYGKIEDMFSQKLPEKETQKLDEPTQKKTREVRLKICFLIIITFKIVTFSLGVGGGGVRCLHGLTCRTSSGDILSFAYGPKMFHIAP